jgi:trk system potassium uptake protein TrkH
VIRGASVGYVLGQFLAVFAACLAVPAAAAWLVGADGAARLGVSALATGAVAALLAALTRRPTAELNQREALLLVVATWIAATGFGALPFYLSPHFPSFTDAYFESISGFTTTGATVLPRVEVLPAAVQFWRCFTHWIGGMGIVLLGIAVLPLVGHGGMQLYRAEFSGARSEKLRPRITETALALWKIYFLLTAAEFVTLWIAGMTAFEAACHTFSTLGTGGFSTRTASLGDFASPTIDWIVIVFMLLSGTSFIQQYRLWIERQPGGFFRDVEVRAYLAVAAVATMAIAGSLVWHSGYGAGEAVRAAAFQATSILTTTGLVTHDFERWHPLPQVVLLALMFIGGCTGSTAGGLKASRIVLLARVVDREFRRMVERRGVFAVRLGGQVIAEPTVQSLLNLVYLAFVVNFASVLLLAAVGVDVLTAISAAAASMFNVGPGLGLVGPSEHYGHLPGLAKWVLSADMLAGRLEFYSVLVILTPAFWRR